MACTDAHSCILLSYHPETKTGNFFLVRKNDSLINIVMAVCDSILRNEPLIDWYHEDDKELQDLDRKLVRKKMDFHNLKHLRTYIKSCTKQNKPLKFIDEIDFELSKM